MTGWTQFFLGVVCGGLFMWIIDALHMGWAEANMKREEINLPPISFWRYISQWK